MSLVRAGFSLGISVSGPPYPACLYSVFKKSVAWYPGEILTATTGRWRDASFHVSYFDFHVFVFLFRREASTRLRRSSVFTNDEERRRATSTCHENRYFGCLSFAHGNNIMRREHIGNCWYDHGWVTTDWNLSGVLGIPFSSQRVSTSSYIRRIRRRYRDHRL